MGDQRPPIYDIDKGGSCPTCGREVTAVRFEAEMVGQFDTNARMKNVAFPLEPCDHAVSAKRPIPTRLYPA